MPWPPHPPPPPHPHTTVPFTTHTLTKRNPPPPPNQPGRTQCLRVPHKHTHYECSGECLHPLISQIISSQCELRNGVVRNQRLCKRLGPLDPNVVV